MKIIAERIFELSDEEMRMIREGLSAQISDYCVGNEDEPYIALLNEFDSYIKEIE